MLTRGDEETRLTRLLLLLATSTGLQGSGCLSPVLVILELVSSCFWVYTDAKEGLASLLFFGLADEIGSGVFLRGQREAARLRFI